MSAVTKVLVVLLVVLCIAFSMTAVAFTARTENWKALAEEYRTTAQIANAEQRNLMASQAAELASARDTIKTHLDRINALEHDLQQVTQDGARQQTEIAQLTADKRRADALAERLTNELGVAQTARTAVEGQRKQIEERNIDLERRNVDLNERVNELTTQVTVLNQKVRQQEQQIQILRDENQSLTQHTGAAGAAGASFLGAQGASGAEARTAAGSPKIAGHVVHVEGDLVTLSVGSADLVRSGAVFVISRGTQYIGDIEITDVEPNLSSGRLTRSSPGVRPQSGDRADDEYHFAAGP